MSVRQRFEALAEDWQRQQRPAGLLLEGYDLIALRCWSWSDGAKAEGISDVLRAFIQASNAAQREDWMDDYMSDRESCRGCGESYRFENLKLCTDCSRRYCYRCAGQGGPALNGNLACACGGELVG